MAEANEILAFTAAGEWESWLAKHHREKGGVWLLIAKKNSGKASLTITEALDTALCYGWIDSQRKGHDPNHYLQRYSPRRARSPWSRINVEKVEALLAARRMCAAGLAEVEAAKADGRWKAAYVSQRNVAVPRDFLNALKGNPRAKAAFERLAKATRYTLLLPLLKATTPKIRIARLRKAIETLSALSTRNPAPKRPRK